MMEYFKSMTKLDMPLVHSPFIGVIVIDRAFELL